MQIGTLDESLRTLLFLTPIGVVGFWRWSVWTIQKIVSWRYRPVRQVGKSPKLTLSIVVPVYNEDPKLFRRALNSWRANRPKEIIAVIDQRDARCIAELEKFQAKNSNVRMIVTEEPGKRPALVRGIREATGDIVALVDSDTIWEKGITESILTPFNDPLVGGVSPRQMAHKPATLAEKMFAIRLNLRYLHEFPYLSVVGDALTCLSGRTAVYRQIALLPLLEPLVNETFFGNKCISGEDKRLTSLLQANGWKVRFQQDAVVLSPGAPALKTYFLQNLRWGRNSWRTDLRMLASRWIWKREPLFAYHLIDRMAQPFTLLLGPIYFSFAVWYHEWLVAGVLVGWWCVSRAMKLYPHLRLFPKDILILPFFILSQYVLAVIKIYALFTMDFQSWITRWDKDRLRRSGFWMLLPAKLSAALVVLALAVISFQHSRFFEAPKKSVAPEDQILFTRDFAIFGLDTMGSNLDQQRLSASTVDYVLKDLETPASIRNRFNLKDSDLISLFPGQPSYWARPAGTRLILSVEMLKNIPDSSVVAPAGLSLVTYDRLNNVINVRGNGSVVTLSSLARKLRRTDLIENRGNGEWIVRVGIHVGDGVTLAIDGSEVKRLKLKSEPGKFVYLRSYDGRMVFRGVTITSWDETNNAPDLEYKDGRAYIVAQGSGRMDIDNCDIGFLGFSRDASLPENAPSPGGIYGLAWKIANGSFGQNVLTGSLMNSRIHDNYFGVYSYGASALIISKNEIYGNIQYGIDPHDDSNNLLIEGNYVHDNGNHGIIGSKRVVYSVIRNNLTVGNRLHGIMLDRQSNYNLVEGNTSRDNVNGLAIYDSHSNVIRNNNFRDNKFGIRANNGASGNYIENNEISGSEKGIFFYGGAQSNMVVGNDIHENRQAVAMKDANLNVVTASLRQGENLVDYKLDDLARGNNYVERPISDQ